jgi:hypothetical protein
VKYILREKVSEIIQRYIYISCASSLSSFADEFCCRVSPTSFAVEFRRRVLLSSFADEFCCRVSLSSSPTSSLSSFADEFLSRVLLPSFAAEFLSRVYFHKSFKYIVIYILCLLLLGLVK